MDLHKLLRPKRIAVIGANDKNGFGKSTCLNLLNAPVSNQVYFVNPKREILFDRKCYPHISALPETMDMCILILNKTLILNTLRDIAAHGCHAAVVYASGYGETGDKTSEKELKDLCQVLDMAVMGVNCAGYINNLDGIPAFGMLIGTEAVKGNVAIISQSGKICLNMMQIDYMKFSYLISSGNGTCIRIEDYLEYLIDDSETKVIGLYMEGIKNPVKFKEVLIKAALRRKPIVIMKVGKTARGSALAASHTGSLSGSDASFDAVMKKFGVIRVNDIEELAQMCHLLSTLKYLPSAPGISAMCLSGGETGVCADSATLLGLDYPEFSKTTGDTLSELLPGYATVANPLDMSATLAHDGPKYAQAIQAILEDPAIGMVICGQTILEKHKPGDVINPMSDGMVMAAQNCKKPIAVMNFFNSSRDKGIRAKLEAAGVALLPATGYGFQLVKYLTEFASYDPAAHTLDLAIPDDTGFDAPVHALSEHESKMELKEYGVPVPEEAVITGRDELKEFAKRLSYPAAAKIASRDILHKSDMGGVKLGLSSEEELLAAYEEILQNASEFKPDARIDGILVQPMLPKGIEVIVGVSNDPQFGPMVLCGLGGIFVEVFKDVSLYPAPLNKQEALKMIQSLKGSKLLMGCRGTPKCDIAALADFIVHISQYAAARKNTLKELDINPIFVYEEGKGIAMADALIVKHS